MENTVSLCSVLCRCYRKTSRIWCGFAFTNRWIDWL